MFHNLNIRIFSSFLFSIMLQSLQISGSFTSYVELTTQLDSAHVLVPQKRYNALIGIALEVWMNEINVAKFTGRQKIEKNNVPHFGWQKFNDCDIFTMWT